MLVGTLVAGPAWVWMLPVAFAGQCLLLAVYSELAAEFPISGGAYQWTRRLAGDAYGWLAGWVAICAYAAANTTIAYLGAPWALTVAGVEPSPGAVVLAGVILVVLCAAMGLGGIELLRRAVRAGALAEALALVEPASSSCSPSASRSRRAHLVAGRGGPVRRLGPGGAAGRARRRRPRPSSRRLPSVHMRDQVRRELRRLGARSEPRTSGVRGAAGLDALSGREREVAELVADRPMNKQIATTLFLSEKTVESHLRTIFRKLSVSSRAEVAQAVLDRRKRTT